MGFDLCPRARVVAVLVDRAAQPLERALRLNRDGVGVADHERVPGDGRRELAAGRLAGPEVDLALQLAEEARRVPTVGVVEEGP